MIQDLSIAAIISICLLFIDDLARTGNVQINELSNKQIKIIEAWNKQINGNY